MRLLALAARIGVGTGCLIAGWVLGSAIGFGIGTLADQLAGDPWNSNAALAVAVGGFAGAVCGIVVGVRLAPLVVSPWIQRIGALTIVGLLLIGIFVMVPLAKGVCLLPSATEFDARGWRADDGAWPCGDRAGMADELVAQVLRAGMPRSEIVALLGMPIDEPAIAVDPESLVWKVSCQIDCEWLVVRLDDGGNLRTAQLLSD